MNIPNDLLYSKSHEWVAVSGDTATVGLTDYAQHELGDLVYVNMCEAGDTFVKTEVIGDVESIKAVSDIYSPVSGEVSEVNEAVLNDSSLINSDPYGAWLIKMINITDKTELMTAEEYEEYVNNQ